MASVVIFFKDLPATSCRREHDLMYCADGSTLKTRKPQWPIVFTVCLTAARKPSCWRMAHGTEDGAGHA
jgi:hypothetical protein